MRVVKTGDLKHSRDFIAHSHMSRNLSISVHDIVTLSLHMFLQERKYMGDGQIRFDVWKTNLLLIIS